MQEKIAKLDNASNEMEKIYLRSMSKKAASEMKHCFRQWRLLAAQDFIKRKPTLNNTVLKTEIKELALWFNEREQEMLRSGF